MGAAVPDRQHSRPRVCLGFREREPGRLQLRVPLRIGEGVCEVVVEEDEHTVFVRVIVCYDENDLDDDREYVNCPTHVYLEQPLNGRTVTDVETEQPLPLFVPSWEAKANTRAARSST
jgi:hypothetical protein